MTLSFLINGSQPTVESTVKELVRVQRYDGAYFVNLPILYPDGSYVTVRIDQNGTNIRVSDAGFAFRQVDDIGAQRSFKRIANKIADEANVMVSEQYIFVDATLPDLERAIMDVAETSRRIAAKIWQRFMEEEDAELTGDLKEKLDKIFGPDKVIEDKVIIGASTIPWEMSAVVDYKDHVAVFQSVSNHPNSINRVSTAFRDLSNLENPPRLIAVVRSKRLFGPRLALLAPGKVLDSTQDDLFEKAAA